MLKRLWLRVLLGLTVWFALLALGALVGIL